jgi:hypothetical protein
MRHQNSRKLIREGRNVLILNACRRVTRLRLERYHESSRHQGTGTTPTAVAVGGSCTHHTCVMHHIHR